MWENIGPFGKFLAVLTIIFGIFLLILSFPYFVAIAQLFTNGGVSNSSDSNWILNLVLWILSALVLLIVGTCGIVGSLKEDPRCLHSFGVCNIVMWVLGLIILILYYVALTQCGNQTLPPPFDSVCDAAVDDLWLWVPSIVAQFVSACAACTALGMKLKMEASGSGDPKTDNSKGGQWFG